MVDFRNGIFFEMVIFEMVIFEMDQKNYKIKKFREEEMILI